MGIGKIKQIRIKPHSDLWHKFRWDTGIGGSDIASCVAMQSPVIASLSYKAPLPFFLEKINEPVTVFSGNVSSEGGHFFEPIIAKFYRHFDLDKNEQMDMYANIKANKRINRAISPKVYVVNSKWPWLFCSPDLFVWRRFGDTKALGEIKITTSMERKRYNLGVNPAHYIQIQQELMITGLPYCDLSCFTDGKWYECLTIEPNVETHQLIADTSHDMWKRILKARQLKAEYGITSYFGVNPDYLNERQREGAELLSQLEPEITGTDSEFEFIKSMIKPSEEDNPMQGTEDQKALCQKYNSFGDSISEIEVEKKRTYIQLIESLNGANRADFNDGTFFSYKSNVKGARILHVSPRILPLTP